MERSCEAHSPEDLELVTKTYDACWERSRGPYNKWIEGRLHPLARRFYIVVNATERALAGGISGVLDDVRFTLAETIEAFEWFGLDRHAAAVRALAATVDERALSRNHRERDRQLMESAKSGAWQDLSPEFPTSAEEHAVWRLLAQFIRNHPEAFEPTTD